MEQKELMNVFNGLYNTMATSNEPRYMHTFGDVMKCMMKDMICLKQELAQEYIDKLGAIEWDNYLTKKEAMTIVGNMCPKGGWDATEWEKTMENMDLRKEDKPYYNKWALFVTMNMIYSDSAKSVAVIAGKTLEDMPKDELFSDIHMLALDKLEDKDGVFDVRAYFEV